MVAGGLVGALRVVVAGGVPYGLGIECEVHGPIHETRRGISLREVPSLSEQPGGKVDNAVSS